MSNENKTYYEFVLPCEVLVHVFDMKVLELLWLVFVDDAGRKPLETNVINRL